MRSYRPRCSPWFVLGRTLFIGQRRVRPGAVGRRPGPGVRRWEGGAGVPACGCILVVATFLALVIPPSAQGQLPGDPEVTTSIRSLGLGGALPLADRDPDLLFGNPALVERARGSGVALVRPAPGDRRVSMAAATGWWGGGAALGVRVLDGLGNHPSQGMGGEAGPGGVGRTTLGTVTAGYARTVMGVHAGASVTGVEARRGDERDAVATVDLGVAVDLGVVTLGVSGGGLGPSLEFVPSEPEGMERLNARWVRAAFGTPSTALGPLDVAAAGSFTVREGYRPRAGIGVEVGWWPVAGRTFVGRAGLESGRPADSSPWSAGGAFLGDSFTLEYALRPRVDGGWVHGVGVRFR